MTVADLQTRVLERVGEDPTAPVFYTAAEALAWLNGMQRLMVLLTLCLEKTATLPITPGWSFYRMLAAFSDWILPLRLRVTGGAKLKPSRFSDLAALDAYWSTSAGPAVRYALAGCDLIGIYQQPSSGSIDYTYARAPVLLVAPGDTPEVPQEFHTALADGAICVMRAKEGGSQFQKALPLWDRFLDACQTLGGRVRTRNREQGYDALPIELARLDRSKMLAGVLTNGK